MKSKLLKYLCPHYWFNNKKEITFYGKHGFVDKTNPITIASSLKREWVKKAKHDFNEKLLENNAAGIASGHRCLAINDLFKTGFIVKNDVEFAIETNGNDDEIKIHLDDGMSYTENIHPKVSFFSKNLLGKYTSPHGANPNIIKKQFPWVVTTPKDVAFMVIPIPYSDDNRFMATSVLWNPILSPELTLSFWWFVKNGFEYIKKDTPMAQLIPISMNNIYDSWKMIDKIPDNIDKIMEAQHRYGTTSKCIMWSEYRKFSTDVFNTEHYNK